jgi:hypothetical protein
MGNAMTSRMIGLAMLLAAFAGCDDRPLPTPAPAASGGASAKTGSPRIVDDHSESPDWYATQGVPRLEADWGSGEYDAAVKALVVVADREVQKLPRHNGRGARLFARLCALESVQRGVDAEAGLPRILELSGYGEPLAELTKLYARRDRHGAGFPKERARVTAASLHYVGMLATPLAGAVGPKEPAARQQYEAALTGVAVGVTKTLTEAIQSLDAEDLRVEERLMIAQAIGRALAASHSLLPAAARGPMKKQLELAAARRTDEAVKQKLLVAAKLLES